MPICICKFSTDMPNCNGTHRIVKAVRESIAQEIESDSILSDEDRVRIAGIIRKSKRGY